MFGLSPSETQTDKSCKERKEGGVMDTKGCISIRLSDFVSDFM